MPETYPRDIAYAKLCQRTYVAPDTDLILGKGRNENFAMAHDTVSELHVLCFRGSKSRRDWLLDLLVFPRFDIGTMRHLRLGLLHAGFLVGATALLPAVEKAVAGRRYALCGHSLGGALATLVGALMTVTGRPPVEIVTFGAPRVGMSLFVDSLQHVAIRQYTYGNDFVPMVPTHPPFVHARTPLIHLGNRLEGLWADHALSAYLNGLEKRHAPETGNPAPVAG